MPFRCHGLNLGLFMISLIRLSVIDHRSPRIKRMLACIVRMEPNNSISQYFILRVLTLVRLRFICTYFYKNCNICRIRKLNLLINVFHFRHLFPLAVIILEPLVVPRQYQYCLLRCLCRKR